MDDARLALVGVGTAQAQHGDVLTGHRTDDVGPGHEDAAFGGQDDHVGQRRAVGRAAGRRAEHDRDLGDLAGGLGHRVEDPAHRVQAEHPLGEAGAAGVPDPEDRHPVDHGPAVGLDHHLAAVETHCATHHRGVGAEGHDGGAVDGAGGGEHARTVVLTDQGQRTSVQQGGEPEVRIAGVLLAGEAGGLGRCACLGHDDSNRGVAEGQCPRPPAGEAAGTAWVSGCWRS